MVFEKIRAILAEQLDIAADEITMESNIAEDLGADSLDVVDLIMSIEDEFDLEVPDTEVENIKTVGDVVNCIESAK
jgi:acyl carrier protein